jgi:CRP-like cAMP-binding protein
LIGNAIPQSYSAGIELFRQLDSMGSIYLIADGLVKLTHVHSDGRVSVLGLRSRGWILGAASAIRGLPYATTASTLTKCRLHRVAATRFRQSLQRKAALSWYVHEMHSRELHEQLFQILGLGSLSARERLEAFFAKLLPPLGSPVPAKGIRLEIPLHLSEVAQLIAVTPPHLSHLLRDLEGEGVLRRSKGWVFVLDPDRLSTHENS